MQRFIWTFFQCVKRAVFFQIKENNLQKTSSFQKYLF